MLTPDIIRAKLKEVKDPEIPVLSVVAMGIIHDIRVEEGAVEVDMVPTFAGCPAIDVMKKDIEKTCMEMGAASIQVNVLINKAWSTNQMTKKGKASLKKFGISPPKKFEGEEVTLEMLQSAECPKCGSTNTTLKNSFGPTACRAIHHCNDCHETFEQMKPL
ncbi:MAG: 1,2-phenylacetyl-CoA epoxidase subunit PaaD [Bacteroidota bacterium]